MTREELINMYPFLKVELNNAEYLEPETDTWLDAVPEIWYQLVLDMCKEIKEVLIENDFLSEYEVYQVKEKFGSLRWYDNTCITSDIIRKYEDMSCSVYKIYYKEK